MDKIDDILNRMERMEKKVDDMHQKIHELYYADPSIRAILSRKGLITVYPDSEEKDFFEPIMDPLAED
jgi:hypothetical protein